MKQSSPKGSLTLLFIILCAAACKKSVDTTSTPGVPAQHDTTLSAQAVIPYPQAPTQECQYAPYYGDSIVYPQPGSTGDFYVNPQNNQGIQGTYLSWPGGLSLNSNTGAIDLTKSETGARYTVAFVKSGTTDTCMSPLIVAGAAYVDSVYVLQNSTKTAEPYFNANPYLPSTCDDNQGPGCKFDYNNFAHDQGIEIDQHTGFIDLQKTMQKSPFGVFPINGTTVYTTIYYKLNDNSNFAPQQIQLEMVYYNHTSDIPTGYLATVTNNLLNTFSNALLSKGPSARPPLIIIVRYN